MQLMATETAKLPRLSANALKILGALTMLADHVGYLFFPAVPVLRYVGRLAMPIFSFMIAEGCCHTRSRLRYYLHVLLLAALCQGVYTAAAGDWFLCVPASFAMAIPSVFALQEWKKAAGGRVAWKILLWGLLLFLALACAYRICRVFAVDYGFWGCMLPVAASLFRRVPGGPRWLEKLDRNPVHVLTMALCLVPLALEWGSWQWWSVLSVPVLLLYSGQHGKWHMKYFFYIFYPTHLALLQGLCWLLTGR